MSTSVHLVYIHGFQGNDTSFQSFPTHLHRYLTANVPPPINVRSSLYPTYKSVKPLSYATRNFLAWLDTQPPSNVILIGHSMGGLLAAEAATFASSRPTNAPHRVIGLVAFDVPFLGMHPHVVVSGIASLFPDKDDKSKTEREMNDHSQVHFIDQNVTNESDSQLNLPSPSLLSQRSHSPTPDLKTSTERLIGRAINFAQGVADDPFVVWMRKHTDDPFMAARKAVVERMQFGGCMFNPTGLKERYSRLVAWDGPWVNYWTSTLAKSKAVKDETEDDHEIAEAEENDLVLLETGIADVEPTPPATGSTVEPPLDTDDPKTRKAKEKKKRKEEEKLAKQAEKARKASAKARAKKEKGGFTPARHFIVLPTGLGSFLGGKESWEKVYIGGVEDEVQAHCALFIPGQNLEYDAFVERVGKRVLEFISNI